MAQLDSSGHVLRYTFADLESLWITAGGDPAWAPVMAAVAYAESGGRPGSENRGDINGGSYGLWQINGSHAGISSGKPPTNGGPAPSQSWIDNISVPANNAKEAVALFNAARAGGGSPLAPWQGDAAVKHFGLTRQPPSLAAAVTWVIGYIGGTNNTAEVQFFTAGALNPPPASVSGAGSPQDYLNPSQAGQATPGLGVNFPWTGVIGDIEKLFGDLFSGSFWIRVGMGALGVGMIAAGLWIFLGTTQEGSKAESAIVGATPARALA